ncbi:MAG: CBS domain-containing protein [Eubacteriales bacterium]
MKVKDIMNTSLVTVGRKDDVRTAARLMNETGVGSVAVTETDGGIAGIITDRDIAVRCASGKTPPVDTYAEKIMTRGVVCVTPEHSLTEASRLMARNKVRRLPVCENGRLVGMISLGDISRSGQMFSQTASAFCDISRPDSWED